MIYDLYFHYRILKEAEAGEDENGNPCDIYCRIKLGECDTETRDEEKERQTHKEGG